MGPCDRRSLPRFTRWCRLLGSLGVAGLPWLGGGCAEPSSLVAWLAPAPPALVRAVAPDGGTREDPGSEDADAAGEPDAADKDAGTRDKDPAEGTPQGSKPLLSPPQGGEGREAVTHREIPITLSTVLRLAEEQNPQVALARAQVDEACANEDLAGKRWIPDIYIGNAWYRHEGGIQNEDGTLTHSSFGALFSGLEINGKYDLKEIAYQQVSAERKSWQQKGELSRITSENLLEAASTYIDLLAARTAEAIARDALKELQSLRDRAEKLADVEKSAAVEAERIRAESFGQQQLIRKLQSQAEGASARLVYLLGLDPCILLQPVDAGLVSFDLVDVSPPLCDLLSQALANAPGIHEMEGLVSLIEDANEKARGPARFLPEIDARMVEGAFGAGVGSSLAYDNRWDFCLQFRWNLTNCVTAAERRRAADAQRHQVHLAYADLRGKVAAGVQESREEIISSAERMKLTQEQVIYAGKSRDLSKKRLEDRVMGSSPGEALLGVEAVVMAQLNKLSAIRDYDKAQLRLMLLVGCHPTHPAAPAAPAKEAPPKEVIPVLPKELPPSP